MGSPEWESSADVYQSKVPKYDVNVMNDGLKLKISLRQEERRIPVGDTIPVLIGQRDAPLEVQLVTLKKERVALEETLHRLKSHFKQTLDLVKKDFVKKRTEFSERKDDPCGVKSLQNDKESWIGGLSNLDPCCDMIKPKQNDFGCQTEGNNLVVRETYNELINQISSLKKKLSTNSGKVNQKQNDFACQTEGSNLVVKET